MRFDKRTILIALGDVNELKGEEIDEEVRALLEAHHWMSLESGSIMTRLAATEVNELGYFRHCRARICDVEVDAVRLSYVGEAGWELTCKASQAHQLFNKLHAVGAKPAGVFAQTSMRIEKRFLAFGHDLDTDTTPFQAGLEFTLDWDSDFIACHWN